MSRFSLSCRLGLGLAALGRPGYINLGHARDLNKNYNVTIMETQAHEVIQYAYKTGIRYFDVARSYGRGEEFLGSWLKQNIKNEAIIGSKWGYIYTADWKVDAAQHEVKDHSLQVLAQQFQQSIGNLNTGLRLYQIHSATIESKVLDKPEVLKQLAKIKEAGIYIGFTTSGSQQGLVIKKALGIEIDGQPLFDAVQATWNLMEQSVAPALTVAAEKGLTIIIKEGVANGRLTNRNTEVDFLQKLPFLNEICLSKNCSLDALALAAALAQPWNAIVLSGAATVAQLEANIKALQVNFTDHELISICKALAEDPETYWNKRKSMAWN